MDEEVFVVPRERLFEGEPAPAGFAPGAGARYLERAGRHGSFAPRGSVETDPSLKQLIPYAMVTHGDRVFLMRRTRGGAESRLHGRWSLGVGGHVNPGDRRRGRSAPPGDAASLVENALLRELEEELVMGSPATREMIGVLNDETDPVGQVHLGIVYRVVPEGPAVGVREVGQLEGGFVETGALGRFVSGMETWSRHLARHFWSGAAAGVESGRDARTP